MSVIPSRIKRECMLHRLPLILAIRTENHEEILPVSSIFAAQFETDRSDFMMFQETVQIIHVFPLI